MPIDIDYDIAAAVLQRAIDKALSADSVPAEWEQHTRRIGSHQTNATFVFALGTALLAKATDDRIDALSLKKERQRERAYSARQVGHRVLRPVAYLKYGIHLGVTGREPLNNQPFFRYNRIDQMERVRDEKARDDLIDVLRQADALTQDKAELALAAFLRVRIQATEALTNGLYLEEAPDIRRLAKSVTEILQGPSEGGRIGQAFGAACLDLVFPEVDTTRINDPSRNQPGDVRGFSDGTLVVAMEVRQKASTFQDVLQYAADLQKRGVRRGLFLAIAPGQEKMPQTLRYQIWEEYQVFMTVATDPESFLLECMSWSPIPPVDVASGFVDHLNFRLNDLEVSQATRADILAGLQSEPT